MADMLSDPTLHTEHAAIRHDIGLAEANIRDKVGAAACSLEQSIGETKYAVATEAGKLGQQIGAEACGINTHIGDSRRETEAGFANTRYNIAEQANNLRGAIGDTRQEQAENFGHTRRDIQGTAADIRREQAVGFGDTRYNIAERTGDIRRELAVGVDKTGDLVASTASDIRLEQQKQAYDLSRQSGAETNEIVKEGLKGTHEVFQAIKDNRYDLASRIENNGDRLERNVAELRGNVADRFFTVGRDLADVRQGQATLAKDVELNALRTQLDAKANTQYLTDKIVYDGEKTRGLINDLKYHDLNRGLVERNTALINCEQDRDHWRHRHDDSRWSQQQAQFGAQFAQLQSMMQNFNSQLNETRQGMVNFGTMAGVGQSSTNNNVR